jgi:hypothetical protein
MPDVSDLRGLAKQVQAREQENGSPTRLKQGHKGCGGSREEGMKVGDWRKKWQKALAHASI